MQPHPPLLLFTNWYVEAFPLLSGWGAEHSFCFLFFYSRTSAGGSDMCTFKVGVLMAMSLFILCKVVGFGRENLKASSLCDSFIAACHCTWWPLLTVWEVKCVYAGVRKESAMNVTILEPCAMIWLWLCQHKMTSLKVHREDYYFF